MITFRTATLADVPTIANIHALNWQQNYRGAFSDDYLDHQAAQNRLEVWTKRLQQPPDNQHIIVAEMCQQIIGFSCLEGDKDTTYGTLLDNLHVATGQKGRGIGGSLLKKSLEWSFHNYLQRPMYLWVLCQNKSGIRFYERHGGTQKEQTLHKTPLGLDVPVFRYVWANNT